MRNPSVDGPAGDGGAKALLPNRAGADPARTPPPSDNGNSGIQDQTFDELHFQPALARAIQVAWHEFVDAAEGAEAAGKLFLDALFENAPSLQGMFTSPKAVQAVRFVHGVSEVVEVVGNPRSLKATVETLAFCHLNILVTIDNASLFRNTLIDLLDEYLKGGWVRATRDAFTDLLNYIGGAMPYVRNNFAGRLHVLNQSWAVASGKNEEKASANTYAPSMEHGSHDGSIIDRATTTAPGKVNGGQGGWTSKFGKSKGKKQTVAKASGSRDDDETSNGSGSEQGLEQCVGNNRNMSSQKVPKTFVEMFKWNAQVMGFGSRQWLAPILLSFDTLVTNMANPSRLQQECNILTLKISKIARREEVNLAEFKSCMLASLRSLLPKTWDSSYEVAWNWLWDNVEKLLHKNMGNPPVWEKALDRYYSSIDETQRHSVRRNIYDRFFQVAPAGQEFFKQSDTRLHFIADRMLQMTQEMYQKPGAMVDDISALGLRHVGYAIPTELIAPFVTCCIEVFRETTDDETIVQAFRWSLSLISQMLVGTIKEGSTVVMQAINKNCPKMVRVALQGAPRGQRAQWVLRIQVGSQSISPLRWALESGSHAAAQAMIEDLLTIRADRDRYYYGVEDIFEHHPDIVDVLIEHAPNLINVFFEGLVWRSRFSEDGLRRANFYIKHLLVSEGGGVSDALEHLVRSHDPTFISHPVIILVSDILWRGIVQRAFIVSKVWFVLSLMNFMLGIVVLPKTSGAEDLPIRWVMFCSRMLTYTCTMGRLTFEHVKDCISGYRRQDGTFKVMRIPIPKYLQDPYKSSSLILGLLLVCMCCYEPMLHCVDHISDGGPTEACASDEAVHNYSIFCMFACAFHWALLADFAVFSTGLSAFRLVIVQVMSEIGRFVLVFCFMLLTAASAIVVLEHSYVAFDGVPFTMVGLLAITMRLYEDDYRDIDESTLIGFLFVFMTCSAVILLNLLIAQLNQSYNLINDNAVGYARLKRAEVIVETLKAVPPAKWADFVESLELEEPLEFSQGDVGMGGGVQRYEPATENMVSVDTVLRYGGARAEDIPWPEEKEEEDMQEDSYERIERLAMLTLRRLQQTEGPGRHRRRIADEKAGGESGGSGISWSSNSRSGDGSGSSER